MEFGSLSIFLVLTVIFIHTAEALSAIESEDGTSIIPERFLPPRHFNHHPYTDVPQGPYALNKRGQQRILQVSSGDNPVFNTQPVVFSQTPKKYASSRSYDDRDEHVPKKYMFHYIVHDAGGSGDDFSHAQVHDQGATTGEYRVRLPDGRLQVVKYTADRNGYKAKVLYHDDASANNQKNVEPVKYNQPAAYANPVGHNAVYYAPQAGYVQPTSSQPTYPSAQQSLFLNPNDGIIYLVQDGRVVPVSISKYV